MGEATTGGGGRRFEDGDDGTETDNKQVGGRPRTGVVVVVGTSGWDAGDRSGYQEQGDTIESVKEYLEEVLNGGYITIIYISNGCSSHWLRS